MLWILEPQSSAGFGFHSSCGERPPETFEEVSDIFTLHFQVITVGKYIRDLLLFQKY